MASALCWACLPGTGSPPLPARVPQMSGHLSAWGTRMGRAGVGRRAWGPGLLADGDLSCGRVLGAMAPTLAAYWNLLAAEPG